jgi:hypothetical protein
MIWSKLPIWNLDRKMGKNGWGIEPKLIENKKNSEICIQL